MYQDDQNAPFDTLDIPKLDSLRPEFLRSDHMELVLTSTVKKIHYTLEIKWTTQEYRQFMSDQIRNSQVEKLEQEILTLQKEQSTVGDEKQKFEKAIAKPYQVKMVQHLSSEMSETNAIASCNYDKTL